MSSEMAGLADNTGMAGAGGGLASFEKELICSICTELLYQPLTILNCLHTFCGSCLKEWFSHQHRKACSSRSTTLPANPYSCPTCRADVKDVHHNATVSNLLELFLAANPSRARSQEEKDDMDKIYKPDGSKPGDKILPKVERRREKRMRREEEAAARERDMVDGARQRSLREFEDQHSSSAHLEPPRLERSRSASGEREDRRQRRRERERQREQAAALNIPSVSHSANDGDRSGASSPPATSPRHPDAVEARQRAHRMSHQTSLRSLVSASESGTGTGDSLDEARIMQEIIDEGLLGDIDVDSLTEAEQDLLAERIAEMYRQRHPRASASANSPPRPSRPQPPAHVSSDHSHLRDDHRQRSVSAHGSPPAHSTPSQSEPRPRANSSRPQAPPPSTIGRSNSQGSSVTIHHRRRPSDQPRQGRSTGGSRASSVERPGTSSSASNVVESRAVQQPDLTRRDSNNSSRTSPEANRSPRASEVWLQVGGEDRRLQSRNGPSPSRSPRQAQTLPNITSTPPGSNTLPVAELDGTSPAASKSPKRNQYDEPSITCFRCNKIDIQYEIFRHCRPCNVNLCMKCYRQGEGCKHWYGFGHAAEVNFENSKTRDDTTPEPHVLIGRQYRKPVESTVIHFKTSPRTQEKLPKTTSSNPLDRLQEGHFCDRCGTFANSQFWLCDICNDGEWGFCKQCVQTHHCCPHPLLPVAYYPQSLLTNFEQLHLGNTHPGNLQPLPPPSMTATGSASANNSRPHTPNSNGSRTNHSRRESGYDYLSIDVTCDICHQIIFPQSLRYHCPSHTTDFDICTSCYNAFIQHARARRDGNNTADATAGWRKCPQGHRMVTVVFEPDVSDEGDGGMRRVVKHDLVGGWKMTDADIRAWNSQHNLYASPPTSPPLSSRGTWSWKEDASGTRKGMRSRSSTLTSVSNGISGLSHSNMKFPPDGGLGTQGVAYYAYWPEDGEDGAGELKLPRGAEVREIEDVNGDWWSGVYAGDVGVFPYGYVRDFR